MGVLLILSIYLLLVGIGWLIGGNIAEKGISERKRDVLVGVTITVMVILVPLAPLFGMIGYVYDRDRVLRIVGLIALIIGSLVWVVFMVSVVVMMLPADTSVPATS